MAVGGAPRLPSRQNESVQGLGIILRLVRTRDIGTNNELELMETKIAALTDSLRSFEQIRTNFEKTNQSSLYFEGAFLGRVPTIRTVFCCCCCCCCCILIASARCRLRSSRCRWRAISSNCRCRMYWACCSGVMRCSVLRVAPLTLMVILCCSLRSLNSGGGATRTGSSGAGCRW